MSVVDFEVAQKEKEEKPAETTVSPAKIIVLALARDHRGLRAKLLAETLSKSFPNEYQKPLVKFYHDIGWRETIIRLRKASKRWDYIAPVIVFVNKHLIGDDDDFNLFIRDKHFLLIDPEKIQIFKNMSLLDKLQMNPLKTYIYFDVSIDYRPVGRMIFQIEGDTMPQSTKGFLELCCSQKNPLPEGSYRRSRFAGSLVRRIVKTGWVRITTLNDERTYAGGKYEKAVLSTNRRGTLVMNMGPRGWLSSHIIILLDQHPWMEKMYRAIGYLIDGEYILHLLETVPTTYEHPNVDVVITDNGILYSPNLMTTESFLKPELMEAASKLKSFRKEYKKMLSAYVHTVPCLEPDVKKTVVPEVEPEEKSDEIVEMTAERSEGIEVEGELGEYWGEDLEEGRSEILEAVASTPRSIKLAVSKSDSGINKSVLGVKSKSNASIGKSKSNLSSKKTLSNILSGKEPSSVKGEDELGEEEEVAGEEEAEELSEPDIQYTYTVPIRMANIRTAYKKFEGGKHVESYQKVGIKLPTRREYEKTLLNDHVDKFEYIEPYSKIDKDADMSNYYEISKKTMSQVTPELLLTWAQGIDDDQEIVDIEKAIGELLEVVDHGTDQEGHALDAISMEDCEERYKNCLYSLPPQLLHMLNESLKNIATRQKATGQPILVTGESTSRMGLVLDEMAEMITTFSDDVISGYMFSLIEFTKRMIESNTELVPNVDNLDYVTSLVDDVILRRVLRYVNAKQKKKNRIKKKKQLESNRSIQSKGLTITTSSVAGSELYDELRPSSSMISGLSMSGNNLMPKSATLSDKITIKSGTASDKLTQKSTAGSDKLTPKSTTGSDKLIPKSATGSDKLIPKSATGSENTIPNSATGSNKLIPKSATGSGKFTPDSVTASKKLTSNSAAASDKLSSKSPITSTDKLTPKNTNSLQMKK